MKAALRLTRSFLRPLALCGWAGLIESRAVRVCLGQHMPSRVYFGCSVTMWLCARLCASGLVFRNSLACSVRVIFGGEGALPLSGVTAYASLCVWWHLFLSIPRAVLPPETFPYGVGQGALGIECREGDEAILGLVSCVTHVPSSVRCRAERALMRALQGGCQVPIGVRTALSEEGMLDISAAVLSLDGAALVQVRS